MAKLMHAAGSKGRDRVTSDQLKEFRNQVSRGHINRETLQTFLMNEGDPLSRFESVQLFDWKVRQDDYFARIMIAMQPLTDRMQLSEADVQPFIHRLDGSNDVWARLRFMTSPIRSFWPNISLALKPANPETELLAERGIFWENYESVQFVTTAEAFQAFRPEDPQFTMFQSLFQSRKRFMPELAFDDEDVLQFNDELLGPLTDMERGFPWETTRDKLYQAAHLAGQEFDEVLKQDWRDYIIVAQDDNLFSALELAIWYHWTGQSYRLRQIRNFLTMYHLGNFPQGIYQNKLIVLCADK